ncbi:MAG TPA: LysE family translocator [Alphaproteobacteria bacterium]|jgi:threonine/homoserine/homoserine lactone efflux protein|nr:LysE family translocator [Alphaproteobacteria bacterium]
MPLETWIAFTFASIAVVLIPGPNIILTVGYVFKSGRSTGWATVPGVVAGAFVAMTLSLLGAGAIIAASATLFSVMKYAGAAYLVWLAYKLWNEPNSEKNMADGTANRSFWSMFIDAFAVSALNPKGPIFYIAFIPQFVSLQQPVFDQFVILEATFLMAATVNSLMWIYFANGLRSQFKRPSTLKIVNRIGATFLFGAGVLTANASRTG